MNTQSEPTDVARIGHSMHPSLPALAQRYGMTLAMREAGATLTGSFWGDSEAGLHGNVLYVRPDTPLHSLLHELSHYVCMSGDRRAGLDRDAGGDDAEECAVCYLQILLADELPQLGKLRVLSDMDAWGYTFRFGSALTWFDQDAADAREWLRSHGIVDATNRPTFWLRQ